MSEARDLAPRRATFAVLWTLLGAGIGHVYAGRVRRGVTLLALSFAWAPLTLALSFLPPATGILYAFFGLFCLSCFVTLFALIDSARVARRAPLPYVGTPYNQRGLYFGLALLSVLWFFGATSLIRDAAFEAFRIPTDSMSPTVQRGDRIFVNKRMGPLRRGDAVIFTVSEPRGAVFLKRVIGLPGETVAFEDGLVLVDGEPLANEKVEGERIYEERAGDRTYRIFRDASGTEGESVRVPDGHVFVLGDHRRNPRDSRAFGPIPLAFVRGIAQYIFYPGARIGLVR